MKHLKRSVLAFAIAALGLAAVVAIDAQNITPNGQTLIQPSQSQYFTTAISSTAAVNNQTTLTLPAPIAAGFYNYVCSLGFVASQDGTATANVNAVTTSTNFNAFALKYSLAATANIVYTKDFDFGSPATGCVKSASPTTSTTFVSPAAAAQTAYTWYATYYQAP